MKDVFTKTYCSLDMTQYHDQPILQYNSVAMFILQESIVFQDGSDCAITHILATKFSYE